jgi:subtilisin
LKTGIPIDYSKYFMKRKQLFTLFTALMLLAGSMIPVCMAQGGAPGQVDVLIGFKQHPAAQDVAFVQALGGKIRHVYNIIPSMAATLPEPALAALARNPRIEIIEEDGLFHIIAHGTASLDSELNNTWGVKHIRAGDIHPTNKGAGVKVAIIDSGIDSLHPDLDGRVAGGWNFQGNNGNYADDNGHGTHVAGTVAANAGNGGVVGAAPEAELYALKVLGANGSGSFSSVIAALDWCVVNEIQVSNNSYGSGSDPGTQVRAAFDNSAAAGVLHIAAAGNSGTPAGKGNNVGYPARYDSVVAVAATTQSDTRASFSSTGPAVELAAPGVGIRSTVPGGGYRDWNGTSMASPHVAGVAALVISAGETAPGQVRLILQNSAIDLGPQGRDSHFGFGLVDALAAVALVGSNGGNGNGNGGNTGGGETLEISNVSSAILHKNGRFEISWNTNIPATSEVTFTCCGSYQDNTLKTSHSMVFRGSNGVNYEYFVTSRVDGQVLTEGPFNHQN